jgi:hypothetical protein
MVGQMKFLTAGEASALENEEAWTHIKEAVRFYSSIIGSLDEELVKHQFTQYQDPPKTPLKTLDIIPDRFDFIKKLLLINCTVPVTTCTAERSFSAMKLLKTYLRNRMTDDRLTGLALMYVHPEIDIPIEEVINRFSHAKTRKLDFVI